MVDDIDKLFREKARIDRVTYHSTTGNAKVAFQMPRIVPRDRRHAIPFEEPHLCQRRAELPGSVRNTFPVRLSLCAICFHRHNLGVAVVASSVVDQ